MLRISIVNGYVQAGRAAAAMWTCVWAEVLRRGRATAVLRICFVSGSFAAGRCCSPVGGEGHFCSGAMPQPCHGLGHEVHFATQRCCSHAADA
eukprot:5350980-Karenia_brevis.AAC.1